MWAGWLAGGWRLAVDSAGGRRHVLLVRSGCLPAACLPAGPTDVCAPCPPACLPACLPALCLPAGPNQRPGLSRQLQHHCRPLVGARNSCPQCPESLPAMRVMPAMPARHARHARHACPPCASCPPCLPTMPAHHAGPQCRPAMPARNACLLPACHCRYYLAVGDYNAASPTYVLNVW